MNRTAKRLVESVDEAVIGDLAVGFQRSIEKVLDSNRGLVEPGPACLGEQIGDLFTQGNSSTGCGLGMECLVRFFINP